MVIDITLYNGEREIFEIRYNILKDIVDEFIVVEYLETFSGKDKYSSEPIMLPKVKHIVMSRGSYCDEFVPQVMYPNFNIEYAQREALKKACAHLKDDDIVYVGDVDEIWKPKEIGDGVYKLEQLMYYYYVNNRWDRNWTGTFVGHWKDIKNISWNTARQGEGQRMDNPSTFPNLIKDGGWHFTNCMSLEEIKKKIESYSHQEYNTDNFKNQLPYKIENNIDYYGRPFPVLIDNENLPDYLLQNKEEYKHLFL